jgi:prepilin-type N-terminal cleavage/methylation domain-containing protein
MRIKGFVLIELIIVLILISISISLVAPSLSRVSKTIELKTAAQKISGILRNFRSEAINRGQVYQILFDPDLGEVRVQPIESTGEETGKEEKKIKEGPKTYPLPKGIMIKEVKVSPSQFSPELSAIEFYPNGGSNGGSILLNNNNEDRGGYRIKIHFLTGVVQIERV